MTPDEKLAAIRAATEKSAIDEYVEDGADDDAWVRGARWMAGRVRAFLGDEATIAHAVRRYGTRRASFGTVDRDYNTGEAPVTITMPSGHILTLDPEQPPIYAAEHLTTGQRVAWATWLAGNAVVGAE